MNTSSCEKIIFSFPVAFSVHDVFAAQLWVSVAIIWYENSDLSKGSFGTWLSLDIMRQDLLLPAFLAFLFPVFGVCIRSIWADFHVTSAIPPYFLPRILSMI